MATSNSYDFISNESEIINDAYATIGIYFPGETPSAEDYDYARRQLNRMIKFWGRKKHLWTTRVGTLFLESGVNQYTLDASTAKWTDSYVATTLSAAEALGQTALSVTSSSGMTAADIVGIVLDDGTWHWSTISTVNSSVLITINDALPSAAASGNEVITFTTRAQAPIRIEWVVRRDSSGVDIELERLSRYEYDTVSDKSVAGDPVSYYYDPKISNGTLFVYQTPDNISTKLRITYRRMVQDVDSSTNTIDFPVEWEECIILHLALRLSSVGGIGIDDPVYVKIREQAVDTLQSLLEFDQDNLPLQLEFDDEDV
jgi:hypothetical protein